MFNLECAHAESRIRGHTLAIYGAPFILNGEIPVAIEFPRYARDDSSEVQLSPEAHPRDATQTNNRQRAIDYSQPFALAMRAASTRFAAPSLLMASDK